MSDEWAGYEKPWPYDASSLNTGLYQFQMPLEEDVTEKILFTLIINAKVGKIFLK